MTKVEKSGVRSEMHASIPDVDSCQCKDCEFRDKLVVSIGGKKKRIGVIKSFCEVFNSESTNGKPHEFLTGELPCPYYEEDKTIVEL